MANLKLKLTHLYPQFLNIYGDIGNIKSIQKRCEWRGIEVEVQSINIGDKLEEGSDIYFIGGGQDKQQIDVSFDIQKHKTVLTNDFNNNAVFLGICGGYQLLGNYYHPNHNDRIDGIGLLDVYTEADTSRFIGNVSVETDYLTPSTLVGFENHSGLTYLQGETKPLATVLVGKGNNGKDNTEGARVKNAFGTYMHGPLLPKNPHFTDYLIKLALQKKYNDSIELIEINDTIEMKAHESVLQKAY